MKFLPLPILVVASLLVISGARAQTPLPKPPEGISLRVVSTNLAPDAKMPSWSVLSPQGDPAVLPMVSWNISAPILTQSGNSIQIYDTAALKEGIESKKGLPAPLLTVPVPGGSTKCLLVVRPSKDGKNWSPQIYDESVKQYVGGSRLFLNLTSYRINGSCGTTEFEVAAEGATLVNPQVSDGDFRTPVKVFATLPTRKATVLDEQWAFFPKSRGIALIFEVQGAIRLVGIPDEVPPEPASPTKIH